MRGCLSYNVFALLCFLLKQRKTPVTDFHNGFHSTEKKKKKVVKDSNNYSNISYIYSTYTYIVFLCVYLYLSLPNED